MKQFKFILLVIALMFSVAGKSQTDDAKTVDNYFALISYWNTVTPTKEAAYSIYVEASHGDQNFTTWKKENKFLYIKEIWYYAESFYVFRNKSKEGIRLDESIIDISRFESYRKQTEEVIVDLPGFKDAIVLLPSNSLIYKP